MFPFCFHSVFGQFWPQFLLCPERFLIVFHVVLIVFLVVFSYVLMLFSDSSRHSFGFVF